ncbi:MAG: hypothetical protein V1790_09055 [Planctomycetota bacterium]
MFSLRGQRLGAAILSVVLLMGADARGEARKNLGTALDFAGFDLRGQHNPLSGGIDFLATSTFDGAPFDFGASDLSLSGPLSLQVSTGGRLLSQFDVSLSTAVNGRSAATPLNYVYNFNLGGESMQASGSVLLDADFSLNRLGFYDLTLDYSSRQNVSRSGRADDDSTTHDFDLGPINISGNLYADGLAILTDPLFQRAGRANPFDTFSGRSQLEDLMQASSLDTRNALAAGNDVVAAGTGTRFAAVRYGFGNGGTPPGNGNGRGNGNGNGHGNASGGAVPEPAVVVLMLLGIPAILVRPLRRRP